MDKRTLKTIIERVPNLVYHKMPYGRTKKGIDKDWAYAALSYDTEFKVGDDNKIAGTKEHNSNGKNGKALDLHVDYSVPMPGGHDFIASSSNRDKYGHGLLFDDRKRQTIPFEDFCTGRTDRINTNPNIAGNEMVDPYGNPFIQKTASKVNVRFRGGIDTQVRLNAKQWIRRNNEEFPEVQDGRHVYTSISGLTTAQRLEDTIANRELIYNTFIGNTLGCEVVKINKNAGIHALNLRLDMEGRSRGFGFDFVKEGDQVTQIFKSSQIPMSDLIKEDEKVDEDVWGVF